jgi:hypothetical protein
MKNLTFKQTYKNLQGLTLDELLEEINVLDSWENETSLPGWFAVSTDLGIVAYFGDSHEAYKYRLDLINRILNT